MFQDFLASKVTILSLTVAKYNSGWNGTRNDLNSSELPERGNNLESICVSGVVPAQQKTTRPISVLSDHWIKVVGPSPLALLWIDQTETAAISISSICFSFTFVFVLCKKLYKRSTTVLKPLIATNYNISIIIIIIILPQ